MDLEKPPERAISADEARTSKVTVAVIIGLILVGVVSWAYLEFSADILVDRNTAKRFAARFEKACQSSYTPDDCRKIAGMNHQTCFARCVKKVPGQDGVTYDVDIYLQCMADAQARYAR